jgi:hypothetical protein
MPRTIGSARIQFDNIPCGASALNNLGCGAPAPSYIGAPPAPLQADLWSCCEGASALNARRASTYSACGTSSLYRWIFKSSHTGASAPFIDGALTHYACRTAIYNARGDSLTTARSNITFYDALPYFFEGGLRIMPADLYIIAEMVLADVTEMREKESQPRTQRTRMV